MKFRKGVLFNKVIKTNEQQVMKLRVRIIKIIILGTETKSYTTFVRKKGTFKRKIATV